MTAIHARVLSLDAERFDALLGRLEHLAEAGGPRGGVLAVLDPVGVAHIRAFGTAADVSGRRSVRPDDRFHLTSITKVFTAVQVLTLVEDGLLDLNAPIAEYLPEFGVRGKETITAHHILTHSSGIDATANTAEGPATGLDAAGHLAVAMGALAVFPPGSRFEYSSAGFWVLAELIRRLSD